MVVVMHWIVLGRLASVTAKSLLAGEEINISMPRKLSYGTRSTSSRLRPTRARGSREELVPTSSRPISSSRGSAGHSPIKIGGKEMRVLQLEGLSGHPQDSSEMEFFSLMLLR